MEEFVTWTWARTVERRVKRDGSKLQLVEDWCQIVS
jgi:hypothetical protein